MGISRRGFLKGMAVATGGLVASKHAVVSAEEEPSVVEHEPKPASKDDALVNDLKAMFRDPKKIAQHYVDLSQGRQRIVFHTEDDKSTFVVPLR